MPIRLRIQIFLGKLLVNIMGIVRTPAKGIYPIVYYNAQLEKKMVDEFVRDGAIWCNDEWNIKSICIDNLSVDGLILEFGVFKGASINYMAERVKREIHGFDSFEGLPDGRGVWQSYYRKRAFDQKGQLPKVLSNVKLHKGWFNETLPTFLQSHPENVSLLHIDSDVYSSAQTVLHLLSNRIVPGTIILFDEYFNYDGWQFEEYRAFQEFVKRFKIRYRVLAVDTFDEKPSPYGKVAFVIEAIAPASERPILRTQPIAAALT